MAHHTIAHGTLTLTRRFQAPIARVWKAFEDPTVRAIWSSPVELTADDAGTHLALTVQTAALDGSGLEQGVDEGWGSAIDNLSRLLES